MEASKNLGRSNWLKTQRPAGCKKYKYNPVHTQRSLQLLKAGSIIESVYHKESPGKGMARMKQDMRFL